MDRSDPQWRTLDATLTALEKQVGTAALGTTVASLKPLTDALRTEFLAADLANRAAPPVDISLGEVQRMQGWVDTLWTRVEEAQGSRPRKGLVKGLFEQFSAAGVIGLIVLVATIVIVVIFIGAYMITAGAKGMQNIEASRPILTVAAILATLAFGGGLIFSALFSNEGVFSERFRMAREIFLVFSGVFATIVGFHFGAGNTGASATASTEKPQLVNVKGGKAGELVVDFKGASPPYALDVQLDGQTREVTSLTAASAPLTLKFDPPAAGAAAPQALRVLLKDAKGEQTDRLFLAQDIARLGYAPATQATAKPPAAQADAAAASTAR